MAKRLPKRAKAGYGAVELGLSSIELLLNLNLFLFATQALEMDPALAGLAFSLAILWDAVSDPGMGLLLDRTRTRLGRYVPYLVIGTVLLALSLIALFNPPELSAEWLKFTYLLCVYLLVNTAATVLGVPHIALAGFISRDPNERTELYGWRLAFANIGVLLALAIPRLVADLQGQDFDSYFDEAIGQSATVIAILLLGSTALTVRAVRPYDNGQNVYPKTEYSGYWTDLKAIARNRVFLPLFLAFVVTSIGLTINQAVAFYYYEHFLQVSKEQVYNVFLVFFVVILLSIAGWVWLSRQYGKKWPALAGMTGLGALTCVAYPLMPPGQLFWPMVLAVLGGLAVGAKILFDSLVADVADLDQWRHHKEREGLYFGFWKFGAKVSRAAALGLTGLALDWIGFVEGATEQSSAVSQRLSYLFGPGVGIFFILSGLIFMAFPLTATQHKRIQRWLEERAENRSST